jgi:hypothetical protein
MLLCRCFFRMASYTLAYISAGSNENALENQILPSLRTFVDKITVLSNFYLLIIHIYFLNK